MRFLKINKHSHIVNRDHDVFVAFYIESMDKEARKHGYNLEITHISAEQIQDFIDHLNSSPSKGLIILGTELSADDILSAQAVVREIRVTDVLMRYIVQLVRATREPGAVDKQLARAIQVGASPRASIALSAAARAHAFLDGRGYTLPEDVKAIAPDVLRHRILPTYEAEADGVTPETLVQRILDKVEMP